MNKHTVGYAVLTALLLTFGVSFTASAGDVPPPVFGDFVWNDINGDGIQDFDEPGIANVLVLVCNAPTPTTTDCSPPFSSSDFTDSFGQYSVNLSWSTPGFAVFVDLSTVPTGYSATTPTSLYFNNSGGLLQGQTISDADFGFQLSPVPVPAAVWLFGSALVGLMGMARRNGRS